MMDVVVKEVRVSDERVKEVVKSLLPKPYDEVFKRILKDFVEYKPRTRHLYVSAPEA